MVADLSFYHGHQIYSYIYKQPNSSSTTKDKKVTLRWTGEAETKVLTKLCPTT